MALEWMTGEFVKIMDETPSVRRFFIKIPQLEKFDFKPGQFVSFDLPIHEQKNKRVRSYSIASNPDGTNVFELVIVLVPDGAGTPYLWKQNVGDKITLRGALGVFTLPEQIENDICFLATGTGIAPFRSMIRDLHATKKSFKNLYLIFGSRYKNDILYYKEFEELSASMPNFHYIPTLSRETDPSWTGRKGYVHHIYEELFADKRPVNFYLCGWRNMLDEAKERIVKMGYDRKAIHMEIYG